MGVPAIATDVKGNREAVRDGETGRLVPYADVAALTDAMAELFADQKIMMWSVFFLVPIGRGEREERITADEYEAVFEKLWLQSQRQDYGIKTTEAPHYRRFVLQRGGDPLASSQQHRPRRAPP